MKDITVIFDLDGTMIDTAPDLIAAANHTLNMFGMPSVDDHIIKTAVGLGSKAMLHTAMLSMNREPDKDELKRLSVHFVDYYRDHIAEHSRPFPGLTAALERLQREGAHLGVCTNKYEALAKKLLTQLELDHYFQCIAGADTFPTRKPDPGHLLETIHAASGDTHRSVMIGDSLADAKAAQSAGVHFIAVSFGYGEKPVERLKPGAVIDHFDELPSALKTIPAFQ